MRAIAGLLLCALLLPLDAAGEDGLSIAYTSAPENELQWYAESWHQISHGWRLEPSITFYRPQHGSTIHRTVNLSVGWKATARWDLSVAGGWTTKRDGYSSRHWETESIFLIRNQSPKGWGLGALQIGPNLLVTKHTDDRLTPGETFEATETAIGLKAVADAAQSQWTLILRKSLYDRGVPATSIARFGAGVSGEFSPQHHPSTAETVLRGFPDAAQSLRWEPHMDGPVEFFVKYERRTFTNRTVPSHEYQGGVLVGLGRTALGVTIKRYDPLVHHVTDSLIFEWRLHFR